MISRPTIVGSTIEIYTNTAGTLWYTNSERINFLMLLYCCSLLWFVLCLYVVLCDSDLAMDFCTVLRLLRSIAVSNILCVYGRPHPVCTAILICPISVNFCRVQTAAAPLGFCVEDGWSGQCLIADAVPMKSSAKRSDWRDCCSEKPSPALTLRSSATSNVRRAQ